MKHFLFLFIALSFASIGYCQSSFTANDTTGCAPFTVAFQATATGVQSYSWTFGSGQSAGNVANPTTTYSVAGNYTVTLYINFTNGQKDTITRTNYISVFTPPTAGFVAAPLTVCSGQPVQFTNQSTQGSGAITSTHWVFGDGTDSYSNNPSHAYTPTTTPDTFPVTLIIDDINGCQDFITQLSYIIVIDAPPAAFTVTPNTACNLTTPIQFNWTGPAGATHSWNFGDGGTSAGVSPSHTYSAASTYTVFHSVTLGGCTSTFTLNNAVQVGQTPPAISVLGGSSLFCAGEQVCVNWLQIPFNSISWTSGGGTPATSNLISPCFTYNNAGNYTITATMTDNNTGCSSNATLGIQVLNSPVISFTSPDTIDCHAPHLAGFTSNAPGASTYSWNFGDGGTSVAANPAHNYLNTGLYTVSLTVTNAAGCSTTLTKSNYIRIQRPVADFVANPSPQACVPATISFQDLSNSVSGPIVSWSWDFGVWGTSNVQTPPPIVYNMVGQYAVSLIIENSLGCKDTAIKNFYIKIGDPPSLVDFSASPTDVCGGQPITFTNLSQPPTGMTATWILYKAGTSIVSAVVSGLNPVYTPLDTGWFDVKLIMSKQGCKDSTTKYNYIHVKPAIAKFTLSPTQGCKIPITTTINQQSIYNPSTTNFFWDFGDGTNSTLASPGSHTYTAAGTYIVSLTTNDIANGCVGIVTKTFTIQPADAYMAANQTTACAPDSIQFFNISPNVQSSLWNFGDGTTSTLQDPSHTYTQPGNYTVSLIITNNIGCKDTLINTGYITMNGLLVDFEVDSTLGCVPETIQFTDLTQQTVPISQWLWNFGDGNTSTLPNPSHVYSLGDTFTVTLSVIDANGCNSTFIAPQYVQINNPIASFTANYPINCTNNPIQFTSNSTGLVGGIYYQWQYGDGNVSPISAPVVSHSYGNSGTYNVTLTVTDVIGCTSTTTLPNYISIGEVVANFTTTGGITAACPPLCTNFFPVASPPYNITGWQWEFGDGGSSTLQNPVNCYTLPGNYSVSYVAISDAGCKDTVTMPSLIQIQGPLAPYTISPTQSCPGLPVQFFANGQNTVQYDWDFGDGTPHSTLENPTHIYALPGTYQPVITVWDAAGCKVIMPVSQTVTIEVPPIADFMVDSTYACVPVNAVFTSLSTPGTGTINSWTWSYGDGTQNLTTTGTSPHTYNIAGYQDVTLIIKDDNGCSDTLTKNDYIYLVPNNPMPTPTLYYASVLSDDSIQVVFSRYANGINDFGAYEIYRATGGGAPLLVGYKTNPLDTVFYDIVPAAHLESYCYTVILVNHCGTKSATGQEHCTISLNTTSLQDAVQLDWSAYTGWAVAKYRIWKVYNYDINNIVLIDSVAPNVLTYTHSNLNCWTPYTYRIEALQANDFRTSWSDTSTKITQHFTALNPTSVENVTVEGQKINISWTIPSGISKLKLFQVEKSIDNGANFSQIALFNVPNIPLNFYDNQVNVRRRNIYRVSAADSCGDITPVGFVGGNISPMVRRGGGQILIHWNPYEEWVDGVDFYKVELQNLQTGVFEQIGSVSAPDTSFIDEKPRFVQSQNCYRVRAFKRNDPLVSSLSSEVCTSIDAEVYIPNAFTPNNDDHNDFFEVKANFAIAFKSKIVNRWGVVIFESNSFDYSWDGRFKGKDVPEGVYLYEIEVMGYSGKSQLFRGNVTLIR